MADLDTAQKRISGMMPMMPFRHIGVAEDKTGAHTGKRAGGVYLYGGVPALTYGWGVEAPRHRNAVEIEE